MKTNKAIAPQGKIIYYKGNGTGRDSYIQNINGGLLSHDRIHSLKINTSCNANKPPIRQPAMTFSRQKYGRHPYSYSKKPENRFVHYVSDGSGRDYYVTTTEGGNNRQDRWRDRTDFKFRNTLRAASTTCSQVRLRLQPLQNPQLSNNDVFMKSQTQLTKTQSKMNQTMLLTQNFKNHELSAPKRCPTPPAVDVYLRKGFDASKEFRRREYGKNH